MRTKTRRITNPIVDCMFAAVNAVNMVSVDAIVIWKIRASTMCAPMAAFVLKIAQKWQITIAIVPVNLRVKIVPKR